MSLSSLIRPWKLSNLSLYPSPHMTQGSFSSDPFHPLHTISQFMEGPKLIFFSSSTRSLRFYYAIFYPNTFNNLKYMIYVWQMNLVLIIFLLTDIYKIIFTRNVIINDPLRPCDNMCLIFTSLNSYLATVAAAGRFRPRDCSNKCAHTCNCTKKRRIKFFTQTAFTAMMAHVRVLFLRLIVIKKKKRRSKQRGVRYNWPTMIKKKTRTATKLYGLRRPKAQRRKYENIRQNDSRADGTITTEARIS